MPNRPASFVTVDGNFCTTPEGTPVPQHWMTYDCSTSEFFLKAALFISDFIIIIIKGLALETFREPGLIWSDFRKIGR